MVEMALSVLVEFPYLTRSLGLGLNEPQCKETGLQDFLPGLTQTGLHGLIRRLEAWNFGSKKKRDCTICLVKTKALISCADTAQLTCTFVFA